MTRINKSEALDEERIICGIRINIKNISHENNRFITTILNGDTDIYGCIFRKGTKITFDLLHSYVVYGECLAYNTEKVINNVHYIFSAGYPMSFSFNNEGVINSGVLLEHSTLSEEYRNIKIKGKIYFNNKGEIIDGILNESVEFQRVWDNGNIILAANQSIKFLYNKHNKIYVDTGVLNKDDNEMGALYKEYNIFGRTQFYEGDINTIGMVKTSKLFVNKVWKTFIISGNISFYQNGNLANFYNLNESNYFGFIIPAGSLVEIYPNGGIKSVKNNQCHIIINSKTYPFNTKIKFDEFGNLQNANI